MYQFSEVEYAKMKDLLEIELKEIKLELQH